VHNSLERIRETATIAQSIIESFKDPQMMKNLENLRITADAMQNITVKVEKMIKEIKQTGVIDEASTTIKSVIKEIKQTGVIDEASTTIKSARNTIESSENNQNLAEMISAYREMLQSIGGLLEELKFTIASSKRTGSIHITKQALDHASAIYENIEDA
jgi:cob(I)alamin adenosyltransferase